MKTSTIIRKTNLEEAGSKWKINTLVFPWPSENLEISNLSDSTRNKRGQDVNNTPDLGSGSSSQARSHRGVSLGNSRKYPYPTMDGFHVLTPPPPPVCLRKFQNALPPMPSEFYNHEPPLQLFLEVHFQLSNAYIN